MQYLKMATTYLIFSSIFGPIFASNIQADADAEGDSSVRDIQGEDLGNDSSSVVNNGADSIAGNMVSEGNLSTTTLNSATENVIESDLQNTTIENLNTASQNTTVDSTINQGATSGPISGDVSANLIVSTEISQGACGTTDEHNASFYKFEKPEEEGNLTESDIPLSQMLLSKENSLSGSASSFEVISEPSPSDVSVNDEPSLNYPSVSSAGSHENIPMFRVSLPSESDLNEDLPSGLSGNESLSDIDDVFSNAGNVNQIRLPETLQVNINNDQQNDSEVSSEIGSDVVSGTNIIIPNANNEPEDVSNLNQSDNLNGIHPLGNENEDALNSPSNSDIKPKDDNVTGENDKTEKKSKLKTVIVVIIVSLSITILLIIVLGLKNI
ncbi:hypothetical protein CWI39_1356p0010 [Hamiltosporidium magnivora]|uniref:Uncharacterized protein n=1 Tax=Hamiltosporidium magnivora TaxID=148818 RepID=A0A4Q9L360_9MICR|nr:hypothetical protein CWI39_1356p0010 [Hamiltosporidium magnivora]